MWAMFIVSSVDRNAEPHTRLSSTSTSVFRMRVERVGWTLEHSDRHSNKLSVNAVV
jgi:hypothetical protein